MTSPGARVGDVRVFRGSFVYVVLAERRGEFTVLCLEDAKYVGRVFKWGRIDLAEDTLLLRLP